MLSKVSEHIVKYAKANNYSVSHMIVGEEEKVRSEIPFSPFQ